MQMTLPKSITITLLILACVALYALVRPESFLAQGLRQSPFHVDSVLKHTAKAEAPVVLCIDDKPSVGGQPSDQAYAKAAANGFRSVLTLRAASDGVEVWRERLMVERHRLRFLNLPVRSTLPELEQLDEFLDWVRDKNHHPMLLNCAFAERVAPYMMIFNMIELNWSEERAVEEAAKSGLSREQLRALARKYLKAQDNQAKSRTREQ